MVDLEVVLALLEGLDVEEEHLARAVVGDVLDVVVDPAGVVVVHGEVQHTLVEVFDSEVEAAVVSHSVVRLSQQIRGPELEISVTALACESFTRPRVSYFDESVLDAVFVNKGLDFEDGVGVRLGEAVGEQLCVRALSGGAHAENVARQVVFEEDIPCLVDRNLGSQVIFCSTASKNSYHFMLPSSTSSFKIAIYF